MFWVENRFLETQPLKFQLEGAKEQESQLPVSKLVTEF
jgi:hypothetical protein